jgi:shikimate kinase
MMGAGKTTVGRLLADRLGCPYLDSDGEVEVATGRTVPELFAAEGEAAFRAAETEALQRAAAVEGQVVVAVAGGAVLDPGNRALLRRSGTVVWLRADPQTLARRVGDGAGRPLLDGDPAAALANLDGIRRPLYAELAEVVVDVDGLAPAEVAEQVLEALSC